MSNCRSPNCELKLFDACKTSSGFCSLGDTSDEQRDPTCTQISSTEDNN